MAGVTASCALPIAARGARARSPREGQPPRGCHHCSSAPRQRTTPPPHARAVMSTPARKRLMRDFKRLQKDPPAGISGTPTESNIMVRRARGRGRGREESFRVFVDAIYYFSATNPPPRRPGSRARAARTRHPARAIPPPRRPS
eukprot:31529-Pelagococcus_subviridis.AAC.1